jgi:hypothetical protein
MGKRLRFARPGARNDQQRDEVDRRLVRDAMLDGETLFPVQISQIFMRHGLCLLIIAIGRVTIADSALTVMIWFGTTAFGGKRRGADRYSRAIANLALPRDRQASGFKKLSLLLKNCWHRRLVSRVLSPK